MVAIIMIIICFLINGIKYIFTMHRTVYLFKTYFKLLLLLFNYHNHIGVYFTMPKSLKCIPKV